MTRRTRSTGFALVTIGLLLLVSTAQAADAKKGWFFSVEGGSLTPGNVNTLIGAQVPSDNALNSSQSLTLDRQAEWMEFDSSIGFRGEVGYSF